MKENWVKIYDATDLVPVKIAEDILKREGIASHILHHPDAVMPMLGEAALYAPPEQAEEAVQILKKHGME